MVIQSIENAPKVRLGTVLPQTVIRFTHPQLVGQVGITQPQGSWAAGVQVRLVADGSFTHVSAAAFVQVVAR